MKDQSTGLFSLKGLTVTNKDGSSIKLDELVIDTKIHLEMEDSELTTVCKFNKDIIESVNNLFLGTVNVMTAMQAAKDAKWHDREAAMKAADRERDEAHRQHDIAMEERRSKNRQAEMRLADEIEKSKHERIQNTVSKGMPSTGR
jgi:hypothetical protein